MKRREREREKERERHADGQAGRVHWLLFLHMLVLFSGSLRNISSAGETARKMLRTAKGMVDSLMWVVRAGCVQSNADDKVQHSEREREREKWKRVREHALMYIRERQWGNEDKYLRG